MGNLGVLLGAAGTAVGLLVLTGVWDPFGGDLFVMQSAPLVLENGDVAEVLVVAHAKVGGRRYQPRIDVLRSAAIGAGSHIVWSLTLRGAVEDAWIEIPEARTGVPMAVVALERGGDLGRRTLVLDLRSPLAVAADLVGDVRIGDRDEWIPIGDAPVPLRWDAAARRFEITLRDGSDVLVEADAR